MKWIKL